MFTKIQNDILYIEAALQNYVSEAHVSFSFMTSNGQLMIYVLVETVCHVHFLSQQHIEIGWVIVN